MPILQMGRARCWEMLDTQPERGRVRVRTLLLALPFHIIFNHTKSLGEANDLLGVLERPPQHTELLSSVCRSRPMSQRASFHLNPVEEGYAYITEDVGAGRVKNSGWVLQGSRDSASETCVQVLALVPLPVPSELGGHRPPFPHLQWKW